MEEPRIYFTNARVITPYRSIERGWVTIEGTRIEGVGEGTPRILAGALVVDVSGRYLTPGFIDLHVHGGGNADVMDRSPQALVEMAAAHARGGTTAMLPTTVASSIEEIYQVIDCFNEAKKLCYPGAKLLGLHLEGPYFAPGERGAQDPRYIKNPDPKEYMPLLDYSQDILRVSAAPEIPGGLAFGAELRRRGILAAIAHTNATYDEVIKAMEAGYTHATHLYSSMKGVHRVDLYRVAGGVEAAYLIDEMTVELIADGKHLPPALLKLAYKIKGPSRIALITDAMRAAGMPEGQYVLGGKDSGLLCLVEDGVAKLLDGTAFAGSVATANLLVRNMVRLAEVPILDAVKMMTITPARILGISNRKGVLAPGMDADLVVFGDDFEIVLTMVEGRVVYNVLGCTV
ncbi:MAG: N-acetylglucosamine-6-phosphate deacetylase [Firmicutes bacterium]|nr:N-acetylglucosamine-6-phosphate deacetylase [Bacillota bacterium]